MDLAPPIPVNRAPVLTLWAAVVAERLGHLPDTALTLGRFVAGSSARTKARRLGISDEKQDAEERRARATELKPHRQTIRFLDKDVPVIPADDGTLRAEDDGKPASAKSVQSYVARAFGDRLGETKGAMQALAASLPPEELNRVGFRLYERFRRTCRRAHRGGVRKGSCGLSGLLRRRGDCGDRVGRQSIPEPDVQHCWVRSLRRRGSCLQTGRKHQCPPKTDQGENWPSGHTTQLWLCARGGISVHGRIQHRRG